MLEYFILQLTTIGFEKQYEKYKNKEVHIKTWTTVFISSFIWFLYFTISFSRIVYIYNIFCDKDKENKDKENGKQRESKIEIVTKLSNKILNGIHGILLFNGVFSIIFSIFYLFFTSKDIKKFFLKII